jgi:hypothetical protein
MMYVVKKNKDGRLYCVKTDDKGNELGNRDYFPEFC